MNNKLRPIDQILIFIQILIPVICIWIVYIKVEWFRNLIGSDFRNAKTNITLFLVMLLLVGVIVKFLISKILSILSKK